MKNRLPGVSQLSALSSQLIILTGATGAIGREIARALADARTVRPYSALVLACRNLEKARELADTLPGRVECLPLDLADAASVREFVSQLSALSSQLILLNNAGVMQRHYAEDAQGRELSVVVNYHNTRLLTELLLATGRLRRVVFTTSLTRFYYRPGRYGTVGPCRDARPLRPSPHIRTHEPCVPTGRDAFHQLRTYGLGKRAITDYAAWLHATGRVEVNCADPGIVNTGMITMHRWYDPLANVLFRPFIRSPRRGAVPMLRALAGQPGYIYCAHRRHPLPSHIFDTDHDT